jgi:hypothetical protein
MAPTLGCHAACKGAGMHAATSKSNQPTMRFPLFRTNRSIFIGNLVRPILDLFYG